MIRIMRYLISQADSHGECTMPLNDIIVATEDYDAYCKLQKLRDNENWNIAIYKIPFGHRETDMVKYTIDDKTIVDLSVGLINDKLDEEHFFMGISGVMNDERVWKEIIKHTSMTVIVNAIINGKDNDRFDPEDDYFFYDDDTQSLYSWSTIEGFRKLGISLWDE